MNSHPSPATGRYILKEMLAKGGMGEVFKAVAVGERGFEKPVVIKRILPEIAAMSDLAEVFVEEAKLMTLLSHPNVVEVLDFGRGEGGDYFLVLEYVSGLDLGRLLSWARTCKRPVSMAFSLFIASQALRGLHHAHTRAKEQGMLLVHRDISPSNILLSVEGEVKLADFGVALVRRSGESRAARGIVGKPVYMAPEQYQGKDIDLRADLFAMGVVLFELLTGALPFTGNSDEERQHKARRGEFRTARDLMPEIPEALDALLARTLAPDPNERHPDARSMAKALAECGIVQADSDDVAELVQEAVKSQPQPARKVIALLADGPKETGGEEHKNTENLIGRELTRTGFAGDTASFTFKLTEESTPQTLPLDAVANETPSGPSQTAPSPGRRWMGLGMGLGFLGVSLLGWAAYTLSRPGPPPENPVLPAPAPPVSSSSTNAEVTSASIKVTPQPLPMPSVYTSEKPLSKAVPPSPSAKIPLPAPSASSAIPEPSPAVQADCTGNIQIASKGSFTVSGGPSVVQSPGVYAWRCGSYNLRAVSRADPSVVKNAGVVVKAGSTAIVDLR